MGFSYTVVSNTCEGIGDCIPACPVECIHWAEGQTNTQGTRYVYIDGSECINCHACLMACPVPKAVLATWQPDLQTHIDFEQMYRKFRPSWRSEAVIALAERFRQEGTREVAVLLADALRAAGCQDLRILHHLRTDAPGPEIQWVAELILRPLGK